MHIHRKFWFLFFSRSYGLFELRNLAKMKDTTVCLVSTTPLKPLNRISCFVIVKDIPCRIAYSQEIQIQFFLSELHPFWTLKFDQNKRYYSKQFVSATPLNSMKLCSYEGHSVDMCFYRKCWFDLFKERFISLLNLAKVILCNSDETSFLSDCLSLMHEIANPCIQHSQAMLERGLCELAHSFFHWISFRLGSKHPWVNFFVHIKDPSIF